MRKFLKGTGSRLAPVALALGLLAGTQASAAPIITYNTVGAIQADASKVSGINVIGFNGVTGGSVLANNSNISLGEFQVIAGLGANQTVTYNNVPFTITFGIQSVDGVSPEPNQTPIEIKGFLNGQIMGNNLSTVVASFDASTIPSFLTGAFSNTLSSLDPVGVVPSSTNSGRSSIQGTIQAQAVPEPASIAVFLTVLAGGLGLHRRRSMQAARA